ncbi:MAG TPA: 50S ribosomal protein L29 [Terracidiphilus sp.]|nr:50S ribosomal protein L29 [Terracidiphilus sp.]
MSSEELTHHEKTTAEQLFRLRFQVSMGQNDGVKKLRQLRKEIAQIKTVARERELGINRELQGEAKEAKDTKAAKAEAAPAAEKPKRTRRPAAEKAAEAGPKAAAKAEKAKGARK